jgi:hypothetical protein
MLNSDLHELDSFILQTNQVLQVISKQGSSQAKHKYSSNYLTNIT